MSYGKKVKKMVIIITIISIITILVALVAVVCLRKMGLVKKSDTASNGKSEEVHEDFIEEIVDPSKDAEYYASFETEKYEAKNNNDEVTVVNERTILSLRNDARPKAAKTIQDTINSIMSDQWDNDMKRAADDYRNYGEKDNPVGVNYACELIYQDSTFLTFSVKASGDLADSTFSCDEIYTFSVKTGERLSIDICANDPEKLKNELIQETQKFVKDNNISIKDAQNVGEKELFSNSMSRQGSFGMLGTGICIKYQKNSIADDSAGVITISLDKEKSNSLLKSEYNID